MTADPRATLTTLVSAFERHLEACASRRGEDDPVVIAAADDLADAFDAYDEALLAAYGEMTPLDVYGSSDEEYDDDDDDDHDDDDDGEDGSESDADAVDGDDREDGEDGVYSGFDADDYEEVSRDGA